MTVAIDTLLDLSSDVCGGQVRIGGTRITVGRIATLYCQGRTAEDIVREYPHLTLSQVYAALAYFHANRDEVEADLTARDAEYDELKQTLGQRADA